jgi:hypothetical protein
MNTIKSLFDLACHSINDDGRMALVPQYLRARVIESLDGQLPVGPDYGKVARVVEVLEKQEASGQWMRPFLLEKEEWWGSDVGTYYERDRRLEILQIHPAPMVKKALPHAAVEQQLTRQDEICKRSVQWLFDYDFEVDRAGNQEARRVILMIRCCKKKVYGVYHEAEGDWTPFAASGSEVKFTYCYHLHHLVEYLLTEKDMDIILSAEEDDLQRYSYSDSDTSSDSM